MFLDESVSMVDLQQTVKWRFVHVLRRVPSVRCPTLKYNKNFVTQSCTTYKKACPFKASKLRTPQAR
jgi:hypothetical protein